MVSPASVLGAGRRVGGYCGQGRAQVGALENGDRDGNEGNDDRDESMAGGGAGDGKSLHGEPAGQRVPDGAGSRGSVPAGDRKA